MLNYTLDGDTVHKDYLRRICEALMICVGTYQLPSIDTNGYTPQIKGTSFFFDTKLLLRFIGCASEAAVSATAELVSLIQNAGGRIYYYPQTLLEMERAFENAAKSLSCGYSPSDDDMRLYSINIQNNPAIITAKKANLTKQLANANIHPAHLETFTDSERIRFDFDHSDLQQYMRNNLPWEPQVIDNDALAIWETHMRRKGDYNEYCGTKAQLPVFVTTNSRLISITLKFSEKRSGMPSLYGWKQNRLPVITDIRLTCSLWSPADHGERMSLLYLTANAVAAKSPTKHYLNSIRELAVQLANHVPEYSKICLPAYFDDTITDSILKHTMGEEANLDINSFATSISELSELKAKDQEKITNRVIAERDDISDELKYQTQSIIDGAVESVKKLLSWRKPALWLIVMWPVTVTVIFSAITVGISLIIGNWYPMWVITLPTFLKIFETCSASNFVGKHLAKYLLPKIDESINKSISKGLRKAEQPYKDAIIHQCKQQTELWVKCKRISDS